MKGIESQEDELANASPLLALTWRVPEKVWCEDNRLLWEWQRRPGRDFPSKDIRATSIVSVLQAFAELAREPDERFASECLRFARRWGTLELCDHGLPLGHLGGPNAGTKYQTLRTYWAAPHSKRKHDLRYTTCSAREYSDFPDAQRAILEGAKVSALPVLPLLPRNIRYDNLSDWRFWTRRAEALFQLAIEIKNDDVGDAALWKSLGLEKWNLEPWVQKGASKPSLEVARDWLQMSINTWLEITGVRVGVRWQHRRKCFDIELLCGFGSPLLGKLGAQLLLIGADAVSFARCPECRRRFALGKGRSIRRNNYCDRCGDKAARRAASKRYDHRERVEPNREKRTKLRQREVTTITREVRAIKGRAPLRPLVMKLAKKYKVSRSTIYKIAQSA